MANPSVHAGSDEAMLKNRNRLVRIAQGKVGLYEMDLRLGAPGAQGRLDQALAELEALRRGDPSHSQSAPKPELDPAVQQQRQLDAEEAFARRQEWERKRDKLFYEPPR